MIFEFYIKNNKNDYVDKKYTTSGNTLLMLIQKNIVERRGLKIYFYKDEDDLEFEIKNNVATELKGLNLKCSFRNGTRTSDKKNVYGSLPEIVKYLNSEIEKLSFTYDRVYIDKTTNLILTGDAIY